ncbi:MAG: hypothetical protein KatS3mg129_0067 [Leptospiraceae bacterium]|nr:MAG: hypothetical protein KatS3mg129_0067 [Leptospiraceae bacterium]
MFHLIVIFLFINVCQTDNQNVKINKIYDFFYGENYIQIIGTGKIPQNPEQSFEENFNTCIKEAKLYADSKWLGVTEKYKESQILWYDRLKTNYYSLWKRCLEEAKIQEAIPVFPDECKIVVHYYCDPQNW